MKSAAKTTVAKEEIARFEAHAGDWWDEAGPFRPLHRLNPVRMRYIRDAAVAHFGLEGADARVPLAGLSALDVGCGGGLLCEPLARLGAAVTGIDAAPGAIAAASAHALGGDLDINYRAAETTDLVRKRQSYDLVCALEVAEHVADPAEFVADLAQLVRPGGLLVMSTINRTAKGFLLGIVAAEYLVRWVPRGTHQWQKFIRPSELAAMAEAQGLRVGDVCGLVFDPLAQEFRLSPQDVDVNYLLCAAKPVRGA
ncbi:MAG: bifunctional 2-polyprenyl-6-hydroxyphenol methylase/3-demethylubiquinol 3-O-methyltransferase UbiG [Alphaproteobacteria bacterium]|nr:bifunctional 2-polyprenyl-6-hydroxyphenol methylase/3-demethylubiquinol 3-O-methyltransferase UbiG [Alphaproteobacteria bacterium]